MQTCFRRVSLCVRISDGTTLCIKSLNLNAFQYYSHSFWSRSRWPRGLRRKSAATRLLRLWVRVPQEAWMFVYCECCVIRVEVSATS